MNRLSFLLALAGPILSPLSHAFAADWHVAPGGSSTAHGTTDAPWDIESALRGNQKVSPGDTVWLRGGTYKHPFENGGMGYKIRLAGSRMQPVQIRALPGQRVTIDGGLVVQEPATHVWIWDLEILVSEPRPDKPVPPDPSYKNVNRPWGGLNIYSGSGCKFINLIIHDNSQGVSWWKGSQDSELYGCILFENGWAATDRGHGHAIYTQNLEGTKRIADCIFTGGFGYSLHAYGSSRADVDNYHVEGNLFYDSGKFLIGGGKPSRHIRVFTNFLHNLSLQLGYNAPYNEDCEVRGNVIANGTLSINKYKQAVNEENLVLDKDAPRPQAAKIILRPNQYDRRRAHLAIFNWEKKPAVSVDTSGFLNRGDKFRLLNPRDFFGPPLLSGTFDGEPLSVPVSGEFAAFVVIKEPAN